MQSQRGIIAAILIGSVIIASGLYLGLRQQPSTQAAQPVVLPPPPPVPQAELEARAKDAALVAIAQKRPEWVARCWQGDAGLPPLNLVFALGFDGSGKEVARGISDDRNAPPNEVAQCLRGMGVNDLIIPPPGRPVSIVVDVTFP